MSREGYEELAGAGRGVERGALAPVAARRDARGQHAGGWRRRLTPRAAPLTRCR